MKSSLNFEELLTVMCDIESVINSRPLTYVLEDSNRLVPLDTSMVLQELKGNCTPDLDTLDANQEIKSIFIEKIKTRSS